MLKRLLNFLELVLPFYGAYISLQRENDYLRAQYEEMKDRLLAVTTGLDREGKPIYNQATPQAQDNKEVPGDSQRPATDFYDWQRRKEAEAFRDWERQFLYGQAGGPPESVAPSSDAGHSIGEPLAGSEIDS